jgi:hypothetical protein
MRALLLPFLLPAVGCFGVQLAWAVEPVGVKLLLERSEDMEAALRAYDFDEIRVFTWRGGLLEGKISVLEGGAIKPVDLGAVVLKTAEKLLDNGESLDPKAISGVLVIAIKKPAADAPKARQCHVSIAARKNVVRDDGKGNKVHVMKRARSEIKGLVPAEGEFGTQSSGGVEGVAYQVSESFSPKGCKKFTLYELKLSAKPAGAGKDEKGK